MSDVLFEFDSIAEMVETTIEEAEEALEEARYNVITEKSPSDLRIGDRLILKMGRNGVVLKWNAITELEVNPRGCKGHTHVNGRYCYDNVTKVEVF